MKVQIHSAHHSALFSASLPAISKSLVVEQATQLNHFVSKKKLQFSPRHMTKEQKLDHEQHCQILFGSCIQTLHKAKPCNVEAIQLLDALHLHPPHDDHNGHDLNHVLTGKMVNHCGNLKVVPVPCLVVLSVDAHVEAWGVKILKIESHWFQSESVEVDNADDKEEDGNTEFETKSNNSDKESENKDEEDEDPDSDLVEEESDDDEESTEEQIAEVQVHLNSKTPEVKTPEVETMKEEDNLQRLDGNKKQNVLMNMSHAL